MSEEIIEYSYKGRTIQMWAFVYYAMLNTKGEKNVCEK